MSTTTNCARGIPPGAPSHRRRSPARLLRRSTIVAGLAIAAVTGTMAIPATAAPHTTTAALAAPAAAVTAATSTPTKRVKGITEVKISDQSVSLGQKGIGIAVATTAGGKPAGGFVTVYANGTKIAQRTTHGWARFKVDAARPGVWTQLQNSPQGYVKIRVVFKPSNPNVIAPRPVHKTITVHRHSSRVVNEAVKYVGVPYRSGGTSPRRGFDCSGFTRYVYDATGSGELGRTSSSPRTAGKSVRASQAQPGDLMYTPGHVAIYVGNGKLIDAPKPGKTVQVRDIWRANWTYVHVSDRATQI